MVTSNLESLFFLISEKGGKTDKKKQARKAHEIFMRDISYVQHTNTLLAAI